jgi:hypothetical protein
MPSMEIQRWPFCSESLDAFRYFSVCYRANWATDATGWSWPRPAIRVEWGTMAFGQSGVSGLNDVA